MIITMVAFIGLMAMAALAIDAGNLYRHRIELQKAADAAVLAGIGYTVQIIGDEDPAVPEQNQNDAGYKAYVEDRAEEIFAQNLSLIGITNWSCPDDGQCFTYNADAKTMSAKVQIDVDLLLMDAVPWELFGGSSFSSVGVVAASASATRSRANLALILDVSGSMRCPAGDKDCSCRDAPTGCLQLAQQGGVKLKIDTLVEAIQEFAKFYDDDDRISIVPFSMRGLPIPQDSNLKELMTAAVTSEGPVNCLLSGLTVGSSCDSKWVDMVSDSNLCDGLMETFYNMQHKVGFRDGKEEVSAVLFLDGAPTAATLCLGNPTANLPVNQPKSEWGCDYSYINYMIRWQANQGSYYFGPSLLVKSQSLQFHWPVAAPPMPVAGNPGVHVPVCHSYLVNGTPSEEYAPSYANDYYKVYDGCVTNLGFKVPGDDSSRVYAANLTYDASNSATSNNWAKIYYLCPLITADVMRKHKWTFFVVGVGYQESASPTDAYQDMMNNYYRKDVFNTRLANDYRFATQANYPENWNTADENSGYYYKYDQWKNAASRQKGEYYPAPDTAQLKNIYRIIAKRIALRLVG